MCVVLPPGQQLPVLRQVGDGLTVLISPVVLQKKMCVSGVKVEGEGYGCVCLAL